jgi:N-acyl-D-aspartate/D-glutamate deacylase
MNIRTYVARHTHCLPCSLRLAALRNLIAESLALPDQQVRREIAYTPTKSWHRHPIMQSHDPNNNSTSRQSSSACYEVRRDTDTVDSELPNIW